MSEVDGPASEIERLIGEATDANAARILQGLRILTESMEAMRQENAALRCEIQELRSASLSGGSSPAKQAKATSDAPPAFDCSFSEYEPGKLFEDQPGFDLTLQFADDRSYQWYRVWSFADAGHALHIILDSCARTQLGDLANELTYRRDVNSVTVYAENASVLQLLHERFAAANATYDGAMKLMETINEELRFQ